MSCIYYTLIDFVENKITEIDFNINILYRLIRFYFLKLPYNIKIPPEFSSQTALEVLRIYNYIPLYLL